MLLCHYVTSVNQALFISLWLCCYVVMSQVWTRPKCSLEPKFRHCSFFYSLFYPQYEDDVNPYLETTKTIYKDLIRYEMVSPNFRLYFITLFHTCEPPNMQLSPKVTTLKEARLSDVATTYHHSLIIPIESRASDHTRWQSRLFESMILRRTLCDDGERYVLRRVYGERLSSFNFS